TPRTFNIVMSRHATTQQQKQRSVKRRRHRNGVAIETAKRETSKPLKRAKHTETQKRRSH
ncbi:MAG: hypothetical protein II076_07100, partial [Bacteroidales bacterium]|nr:hypothetical protein [Bacteroidales bacterium]